MLSRRSPALFLAALCLLTPVLRGGPALDYYLPPGTAYDHRVPTPEQFFGWQVGEWHLHSEQVTAYLQAVAAAAPERVKFEIMGRTHERKPLILLTITAPEHLRDIEKIRLAHLALSDPAQPAQADLAAMPVVVNLGYSIHGNEPSGVNAMVLVAYHLAAARGPDIEAMLRQAVILIETQRNPDGGDRAAQWFNQHRSLSAPSADPADREHNEAWPRGRFNHYWFDPNRDWLPLVHPEAQARAELFHRWRPHLLTDHHEMGSNNTYFFQPGAPNRNNPSSPDQVAVLTHRVAAFHQKALDGRGVFYFSEQNFDDFYPGKGSTYPDLHGTIGILFEQASSRGHVQETQNGRLDFPFTIRNQVLTSFSSLEAALALRTELRELQRDYARTTAELAAQSKVRAYVFGDDGDPARAWALRDLLARHQIEVRPLAESVTADAHTFKPGAAWVVRVDQSQYRLLNEIFVQRTEFKDNVFYDVSAWTLPLAYNLPFAALEHVPAAGEVPVEAPAFPTGALVGGHSNYAYLFSWEAYHAPRALLRLQQAGVVVKGLTGAAIEMVAGDGTRAQFAPGAILVPVGMQPAKAEAIREIIDRIVREDAVTVYGCSTGLTPAGVDFGSSSFVPLAMPKVALITGHGVEPQEIGAAWHFLDQRVGLAPTLLDVAQLGGADLARYNVIVFGNGAYADTVSDVTVAALKSWVRQGGTLVLSGKAVSWAAKKELVALEIKPAETPATEAPERQPYGSAAEREALKRVAGAILAVSIDPTHPLGFGFSRGQLTLCRAHTQILQRTKSPYETPAVYTATPLLSGYVSAANQKALANTAAVVALPSGKGAVVALADDPNFRGYWYGGNRLFFNALFYGRAITAIAGTEGAAAAH